MNPVIRLDAERLVTRVYHEYTKWADYMHRQPRLKMTAVQRGRFEGAAEVAAIALRLSTPTAVEMDIYEAIQRHGARPLYNAGNNANQKSFDATVIDFLILRWTDVGVPA